MNEIENLHKYKSINSTFFSTLINNELWFSSPSDFNDPYDCNLNYDYSNIDCNSIYSFLSKTQKINGSNINEELLKERAKYLFNNQYETEKLGKKVLQDAISIIGITCFSERDDILLMWSHYADGHKGVCLTFGVEKDQIFFKRRYKVDYPTHYPIIDPFNNPGNELQSLLATKSLEWAYEQEVRVVKEKVVDPVSRGLIKFKPEALTEIKFGYKTSDEHIRTIRNLAEAKYPNAKLYKSHIRTGKFGMEFFLLD